MDANIETTATIPELVVTLENPLVIKSNFPQLKAWLDSELVKYEIEVTAETLADAKRAMAELNDLAKKLDRARIDYKKQFSAPIGEWEAEAKKLHEAAIEAREKIAKQTAVFDAKAREVCKALMVGLLSEEYNRLEVREEYRGGFDTIDTLVGISKITSKGALTKAAAESIAGLAQSGRLAQERADGRMARVEADCRAADLPPLTRDSVSSFLDADDATFAKRLAAMIDGEVKRMEQAREKIRREEEAKARAKAEAEAKAKREAEEADARRIKAEQDRKDRESEEAKRKEELTRTPPTTPTPAATPPAPPIVQPAEAVAQEPNVPAGEEQKKTVMLRMCFLVEVECKMSTPPERVQKIMGPILAGVIKAGDSRVKSAEVINDA